METPLTFEASASWNFPHVAVPGFPYIHPLFFPVEIPSKASWQ
jgi:hypothetical protein